MGYLFKNCYILSMDEKKENIFKGDVIVKDNYIYKIGNNLPIDKNEVIECEKKLLMPGFVNTHTHVAMTLMRGYANNLSLFEWLNQKVLPFENKLKKKDIYYGSLLGIAEMLLSGTTTFLDMYMNIDEIAKSILESGIRGCISKGIIFKNIKKFDNETLKENLDLIKKYNKKFSNIKIFVAPHSIYNNTKKFLLYQYNFAKKYKLGINIHLSETEHEFNKILKEKGKTPVAYLESIGFFNDINVVSAHCVYLTYKDILILKKRNISISYNPKSNLKLGSGISPIYKCFDKKINITIGTDSPASNNNLDMLEELQYASLCQKGFFKKADAIKALDALKMATINGAKALDFNNIGKIKEGYKADLILFDLNKPHYYPLQNSIIDNIVYSGKSNDIIITMVDGKILMKNRKLLTINLNKIYKFLNKNLIFKKNLDYI